MRVSVEDYTGNITIRARVKRYVYRLAENTESIGWADITILKFPEDRLYFEQ